jgi:uncharacterized protein YeaO (DUF488 family)
VKIALKRAYEPPADADGCRILVDRLWPRGLRRDGARIDEWLKDIAPSTQLREWFAHDPARWAEFRRRYGAELRANADAFGQLRTLTAHGTSTLLFATRDATLTHARILREKLLRGARRREARPVTPTPRTARRKAAPPR